MKAAVAVLLLGAVLIHAQDSSEWGQGNGQVQTNCTCGYTNKNGGRIVGGRDAQVNEYPLIAGIIYRGMPSFIFCGGTIITERHVLTAAHCRPDNNEALSVVLAEHKASSKTESKTTIIDVTRMISHEQYDLKKNTENDIALLVLASQIPFGKTIGPACFPKANLNIVGQKVRVIGWGALASGGRQPDILQKVDLDVQPTSACSRVYKGITEGQLCTYTLRKDACQGDSGGPVIWRDPGTSRYTIVGVVSYGYGCAEPGAPGVNTKVSAYRDWVLQKIQQTVPSAATCQNK
uniref:limulus clotting factor C n=1 Tax=Adelphocoris suturalis TaxID=323751 RepID=A0A6C0WZ43_9HEMI|nr:trypsin precursor [Adelphocoris suturalis]